MSVSAAKPSLGPSLASLGSLGSTFAPSGPGKVPGLEAVDQTLRALSQNPIVRSLLGESGFDGVQGKGKTDKAAQAGEQSNPLETLSKILDTLKQLVSVLQTLSGQKPGTEGGPQQAAAPGGAQQPGGAGAPANQTPAPQAGGPQGAEGVGEPEGEGDPLQKLLKVLEQIIGLITQLQQKLGGQQGGAATQQPPGAEAPVLNAA